MKTIARLDSKDLSWLRSIRSAWTQEDAQAIRHKPDLYPRQVFQILKEHGAAMARGDVALWAHAYLPDSEGGAAADAVIHIANINSGDTWQLDVAKAMHQEMDGRWIWDAIALVDHRSREMTVIPALSAWMNFRDYFDMYRPK